MKPTFQWIGDRHDTKSGTARWDMPDQLTVILTFQSFSEAFSMNQVVEAAYAAGVKAGRRQAVSVVGQALLQVLPEGV